MQKEKDEETLLLLSAKCNKCNTILPKSNFSNRQWKVSQSKRKGLGGARCISCVKSDAPHTTAAAAAATATATATIATKQSKGSLKKRSRNDDDNENNNIDTVLVVDDDNDDNNKSPQEEHNKNNNKKQKKDLPSPPLLNFSSSIGHDNDNNDTTKTTTRDAAAPAAKHFEFHWPLVLPSPTRAQEDMIASVLVRNGEYGPVTETRRQQIEECLTRMNQNDQNNNDTTTTTTTNVSSSNDDDNDDTITKERQQQQRRRSGMTMDQALSYRICLLQEKTMRNHFRMNRVAKEMARLYTMGGGGSSSSRHRNQNHSIGVVELSRRFDFPPMNVFRTILGQIITVNNKTKQHKNDGSGKNKTQSKAARIKACLRDPTLFDTARERYEFYSAEANDLVSSMDQSKSVAASETYESDLVQWFTNRGVRLRPQKDMIQEQIVQYGRAICTPDIFFVDQVSINGTAVAWMDAKNFYGANVLMHIKSTEKQVAKYVKTWGPGAVVYRHGFSETLSISGCTLLDGRSIYISK